MSHAEQFVQIGLSHVGCGYVYGTNGEILTEALLRAKQKQLDPNQTGSFRPSYMDYIRANYMNKRVFDCSGLVVSICREMDLDEKDYTASSLYFYKCNRKPISDIVRGDLVFKKNKTSGKIYHVGIYLGDGKVLEAQGTMYGVKINRLSSSWTLAGRLYVLGDEPAQAIEEPYTGYYEVEVSDYLNVRETPSGRILERLVPHDYVAGLGLPVEYKNGYSWVKVECLNPDATGWVAEKYLKKIDKLPS